MKDGTLFTPGETFAKTWRLQNIGTCTWTRDYALVFADGDRMAAPSVVSLPTYVYPDETIDLSVKLVAPEKIGDFRGYWQLRNDKGILFGGRQRTPV